MKKKQKTLNLKKIQISKLQNPHMIYGGATQVGEECGTGGGTEEQEGEEGGCLTGSRIILTNTEN